MKSRTPKAVKPESITDLFKQQQQQAEGTRAVLWIPENDLLGVTARAAQLLNIPVEDVRVYDRPNTPYFQWICQIERIIKREGILAPYTFRHAVHGIRHSCAQSGYGLELFESEKALTKEKRHIRFVHFVYPSNSSRSSTLSYLFLSKDDVFRFFHNARHDTHEDELPTLILDPILWQEIQDNTIGFLSLEKAYRQYKIRPARGLLLHGSPGNGKTQICRWLITYCGNHGISTAKVLSADILESHKDGNLSELVNGAKVIFFDDIDIAFFTRRDSGGLGCDFLNALDGTNDQSCCVRIFTTNEKLQGIDDAFKRPGRIDRSFELLPPTMELRQRLVETWPKDLTQAIPPEEIATKTQGFTFAELELVRSTLVLNTLLHKTPWDIDKAVEEVKHRLNGFVSTSDFGFSKRETKSSQ